MLQEIKIEDLETDQEKRQNAFEEFVRNGIKGTKAKIMFAGDLYRVKLRDRSEQDGVKVVRFEILGNRHSMDGKYLAFDINTIHTQDDSELLEIIK